MHNEYIIIDIYVFMTKIEWKPLLTKEIFICDKNLKNLHENYGKYKSISNLRMGMRFHRGLLLLSKTKISNF